MSKTFNKLAMGAIVILFIVMVGLLGAEPDSASGYSSPEEYVEFKMQTEYPDMTYDDIVVDNYRQSPDRNQSQLDYRVYDQGKVVFAGVITSGEVEGLYF